MSDLTDALAWFEDWSHDADSFRPIPIRRWPEIKKIVAAARRVTEAPEVWWCEYHDGAYRMFHYPTCPHAAHTGDDSDCRMVRKLLVDPPHPQPEQEDE